MIRYQQFLHMSALSTLRSTCCHGLSFCPQCGQVSKTFVVRSGGGVGKDVLRFEYDAFV